MRNIFPTSKTTEDHYRVMKIPAYKRWYDNSKKWMWNHENRQRVKADKMRAKAKAKYDAELERIYEWQAKQTDHDAVYQAWKKEDDKRYWKLRKV